MSDHRASTSTGNDPARRRRRIFSSLRRVTRLWGFLGFVLLVLVLARGVILPFVFALLVAHILAPVVRRMAHRPDDSLRMPRWVAVIICYIVFLGVLSTAMVTLLPRFTGELTRMAGELPALYKTINDEWAPKLASWVEERFPAAERPRPPAHPIQPGQSDFLPRDTTFVLSPLPDGRTAVELPPGGLALIPRHDGGFDVRSDKPPTESVDLEDRIRLWTRERLQGLQSRVDDLVRVGQGLVVGFARGIFSFFLVLMVAAFILLDLEKVNGFGRSLVPMVYREDYDRIAQSINRGLTGVIRGQLIICLVNGVLTYIGLIIFKVDYALIMAMVAAVLSVIPIFGSIVSTIPIVLVALLSGEGGGARGAGVDHRHPPARGQHAQPQDHGHVGPHPPVAGDLRADRGRALLRAGGRDPGGSGHVDDPGVLRVPAQEVAGRRPRSHEDRSRDAGAGPAARDLVGWRG
jgi:predicted PurR-regulated permease PerM